MENAFINPTQMQFIYNVSLVVALWAAAIRIGLTTAPAELLSAVRNVRAVTRALLLNLLILPLLVWGLTQFARVDAETALGLLLLAAAPGGPFGLVATQIARGDAILALLLISVLQITRILTIPLWLGVFLSFGPQEFFDVIIVLIVYLFVPLVLGLGLQKFSPARTRGLIKPLNGITTVALVSLFASAILLYAEPLLALIFSWTMLLILTIQAASFGMGYWFGGAKSGERRAVALTALIRSSAAALLIATQVYAGQPQIVATVVAYGVSALVTATLAAFALAHAERILFRKTESANAP